MLRKLVINDIFKQKRTKLLLFVIAIPTFISLLLYIDMHIRYKSYLYPLALKEGITSWQMLVEQQRILYFNEFLPLFCAIIISALFENEYKNNGWILTLTYPVSRSKVIISKFITSLIYMIVMLITNIICLIIVGKLSGFPEAVNEMYFAKIFFIQFMASAAVMVIHLYLTIKNKNTLVSIGTAAALCIISSNLFYNESSISKFNPYSFASFVYGFIPVDLKILIIISLFLIVVGLAFTIIRFDKKECY